MKTSLPNLLASLFILAALAFPATSQATVVNGSILEYQDVNGALVSRTVDFLKFTTTGGLLTFDILASDLPNGLDDSMLWLFNDDGHLDLGDWLAENDDTDFAVDGNADGSVNELDAFLAVVLPAGQYQVAIGSGGDFGGADMIDGLQLETSFFSSGQPVAATLALKYQLTVSGDFIANVSSIPEPASIAWLVFGLGAIALRRARANPPYRL